MTLSAGLADDLASLAARAEKARALVGLDGFVDTILHAVDARTGPDEFIWIGKIRDFADRIAAASDDFASRAHLHSIGQPGFTDAVEFEDGKLMLGKHESLRGISWDSVLERIPLPELKGLAANTRLIAWVNWTCIDRMSSSVTRLPRHRGRDDPSKSLGRWPFPCEKRSPLRAVSCPNPSPRRGPATITTPVFAWACWAKAASACASDRAWRPPGATFAPVRARPCPSSRLS